MNNSGRNRGKRANPAVRPPNPGAGEPTESGQERQPYLPVRIIDIQVDQRD
jgi:hypothetical protein